MGTEKLDSVAVERWLKELPGWRAEGNDAPCLSREYVFQNFAEALAFVNRVGALAEAEGHHPDIDIRWNKVRLSLTTHSERGLTERDFALAAQIGKL